MKKSFKILLSLGILSLTLTGCGGGGDHEHTWADPTYTWADDYSSCTAERVCTQDSTHKESETSNSTYSVITPATEDGDGLGRYTATFANNAFDTQYHDVGIPSTHTHSFSDEWSYDDIYHWHASTCGHDIVSSKDVHKMELVSLETISPSFDKKTERCLVCLMERITEVDMVNISFVAENEEHFHERIIKETSVSKPSDPIKFGKAFVGWFVDPEFAVEYDFSLPVVEDITLYAKFDYYYGFVEYNGKKTSWNDLVRNGNIVINNGIVASTNFEGFSSGILAIPSSVDGVGKLSFKDNQCIEELVISDSVAISKSSFCLMLSLKKAVLLPGIEEIGRTSFAECENLEEVILPSSLKTIRENAFALDHKLASIELPVGIEVICNNAFGECPITYFHVPSSIKRLEDPFYSSFENDYQVLEKLEIEGLELSADYSSRNELSINLSWTKNLPNLKEIIINGVVKTSTEKSDNSGVYEHNDYFTYDGVLYSETYLDTSEKKELTLFTYPQAREDETIEILDGTSSASIINSNVKYVNIPTGLLYFTMPDNKSVVEINNLHISYGDLSSIFGHTRITGSIVNGEYVPESLKKVVISDDSTTIGGYYFYNCEHIAEITIGHGINRIEDFVFGRCSSLTTVNYNGTKDEWNSIYKTDYWKSQISFNKVHCLDGDVAIS
jgi:hypothetical protein